VPLVHQLRGAGRLAALALLDLGASSSVRDVDVELDQEFHWLLLSGSLEVERDLVAGL
jgi:hypothetical protein